jgi:hypothetical protein
VLDPETIPVEVSSAEVTVLAVRAALVAEIVAESAKFTKATDVVVSIRVEFANGVVESSEYIKASELAEVVVEGTDFVTKVTVTESWASTSADTVTVAAVVESERKPSEELVEVPLTPVTVSAETVAEEGATERTPRPNAATATSATRLNVVFVDISFLSIVELRTIRGSA